MPDSRELETLDSNTLRLPELTATRARLRFVSPEPREVPVELMQLVFGRNPGPGMPTLRSGQVSRSHLLVRWSAQHQTHEVQDLRSRNGSWLNGEQLGREPRPLRDGDVLRLADWVAVYEVDAPDLVDDPGVSEAAAPGRSVAARRLRRDLGRAGRDPGPVVVLGETGAGKELISRELHRLSGRAGPLKAINCAALSPHLIESQLFGHVKGAFTGALRAQPGLFRAANRGTLFLDELGELPLTLQPKLLRVLEEGEVLPVGGLEPHAVDVRVIAATQRDLPAMVEADQFRRDLYARLALWELHIPPLRERRVDLMDWIARFHARWRDERDRPDAPALIFEPDAVEALLLHDWPMNLREVRRLVHRLAIGAAFGRRLTRQDVSEQLQRRGGSSPPSPPPAGSLAGAQAPAASAPPAVEPVVPTAPSAPPPSARPTRRPPPTSRDELVEVMAEQGSVRATARYYGRDRKQIYRWMDAFGLR